MNQVLRIIGNGFQVVADWWREIVGWLLVAMGLWFFLVCYDLIKERRVVEAGSFTVIGIVVFRGGIHLLKVGVAARICREARRQSLAEPAAPPRLSPPKARGSSGPARSTG